MMYGVRGALSVCGMWRALSLALHMALNGGLLLQTMYIVSDEHSIKHLITYGHLGHLLR